MSTTIDSLQIEIQSNSTSAAQGIDALAASLGKLKSNGSVGTAVKNLNNLSDALKTLTPVTSNANKLSALADSLSKLSAVKSIRGLTSQLEKLPGALKGLSGLNIDNGLGAKMEKLAQVTVPLSNIKSGGLGAMVNALSKIGDVTKKLDDDTISRFADRVRTLSDKLTPLSTKMTTIQTGLKGINSSAKSAGTGVQHFGTKVNATTLNMASMITVVKAAISALRPLVNLLKYTISQALEWDGVSQRFGRGFGSQAQETYEWVQRLNKEMGINVQQFMQYSSTYATMLTGFGVASKDASKMALGYMELTYDIWAGYNDIYKSMDDAATAVRSAIAGEVEPVRKAGFTIIESVLEQTAANHGLEISLENATEAQKSYLRYLTLVDQAHAQGLVGTYARELNTAEGLMRTFAQQLKSLAQTFGSVFLPILVKIMPWLSAFVELIGEAIIAVANFFGVEIQKVDFGGSNSLGGISDAANSATDSLGDTAGAVKDTTDALKDLKNATVGIDELNVISPPAASSGAGAGGAGAGGAGGSAWDGLDIDSLWDEAIFDQVKSQVDEIKEKIKGFFGEWGDEIKVVGGLLGALGMTKMLEHLGEALRLGDKFLGVVKAISKLAVTGIVIMIQYTLTAELFDKFIDGEGFKNYVAGLFVSAIGTGILYSMWGPAGLVIGLSVTAAASLKAVIDNGGITNAESATVALTGLASAVGAVGIAVKKLAPIIANSDLGAFFALLKEGNGFIPTLAAAFPKLSGAISSVASVAGPFLAGISAPVWAAIAAAIAALIGTIVFLKENWDEVKAAVKRFFDENIGPKIDSIKESFKKMGDALGPVGDAIASAWQWLKDFIGQIDILDGLKAVFEAIGFVVVEVFGGLIAGAFQAVMSVIDGFVQTISGVVQIVSGFVTAIVKLFSGDFRGAWDAVKQIGQGIVDVFVGLYKAVLSPVEEFVDGVISWFVDLWDELVGHSIVPDIIEGIVKCFIGLPGKVLGVVGKFVGDVIGKFSDFGSEVVDKVTSGWTIVKNWWNTKKGNLSSYTPSIGSIQDKLSSAWSAAKGWWNEKKGKLSTYTPSIGSIYEKVKERWNNAKNWWSNNKGSMSYTPTIGSIKNKLESAWNTAKKWWSKNVKLSIPSLSFKVTYSTSGLGAIKKAIVNALNLPGWPKLSFAKNGGIFDAGSLIWAGEAGAEIVANAGGGKTGVMNVEQMQNAVYEGVYAAVTAAMRTNSGNGGSQSVNVYLDSRQITNAVEQRQHERGASILGRQVYA